MITASEHLPLIHRLLKRYGLEPDCIEIAPNVREWCRTNDVDETNPHRAAKCFRGENFFLIVLCDVQSDQMIASAKSLMELNGFEDEVARLRTDHDYLTHLLLHEIACYALNSVGQDERDKWAFNQMLKFSCT
jgi:hypothetical protein